MDNVGYLNAHYINDGQVANQVDADVPECGSTAPTQPTPAPPPNAFYNPANAVAWALGNAEDSQFNGDECAWFVSNALWAGGFPQSAVWTSSGSHDRVPGSQTAWTVPELVTYLKDNFSTQWIPLGNMSVNAVPQAAPGDIIVYSWDDGQTLDHMSFVTGIASGQYPTISEWGQVKFWPWNYLDNPNSPYVSLGWTWSQMAHEWLQTEYHGHAQAYLLHFNS
jgi:Putative amidase domain